MKTRDLSLITACGILAASISMAGADTQNAAPAATPQYVMPMSAGADEVVKLTKAGVSEPVVLTYVQNAPVAYHPGADEIIRLRAEGVSDKVITAMLQRGGEVRNEMAQTQYAQEAVASVAQPATPAPMVQPQVAYDASAYQQPVTYAATPDYYPDYGPSVVYVGGGYPVYPFGFGGYPFFPHGFRGPHFFGPARFGGGHFGGPTGHVGGVGHVGGGHPGGRSFGHGR